MVLHRICLTGGELHLTESFGSCSLSFLSQQVGERDGNKIYSESTKKPMFLCSSLLCGGSMLALQEDGAESDLWSSVSVYEQCRLWVGESVLSTVKEHAWSCKRMSGNHLCLTYDYSSIFLFTFPDDLTIFFLSSLPARLPALWFMVSPAT